MKTRNEENRALRNQGGTYGQDIGSQIGRSSNKEFRGMDEFIDSDSEPRDEEWVAVGKKPPGPGKIPANPLLS